MREKKVFVVPKGIFWGCDRVGVIDLPLRNRILGWEIKPRRKILVWSIELGFGELQGNQSFRLVLSSQALG